MTDPTIKNFNLSSFALSHEAVEEFRQNVLSDEETTEALFSEPARARGILDALLTSDHPEAREIFLDALCYNFPAMEPETTVGHVIKDGAIGKAWLHDTLTKLTEDEKFEFFAASQIILELVENDMGEWVTQQLDAMPEHRRIHCLIQSNDAIASLIPSQNEWLFNLMDKMSRDDVVQAFRVNLYAPLRLLDCSVQRLKPDSVQEAVPQSPFVRLVETLNDKQLVSFFMLKDKSLEKEEAGLASQKRNPFSCDVNLVGGLCHSDHLQWFSDKIAGLHQRGVLSDDTVKSISRFLMTGNTWSSTDMDRWAVNEDNGGPKMC